MHNPKAGDREHGKNQLMKALAKAGHHATYQSTKKKGWKKALRKKTDVVIAAGGDGMKIGSAMCVFSSKTGSGGIAGRGVDPPLVFARALFSSPDSVS